MPDTDDNSSFSEAPYAVAGRSAVRELLKSGKSIDRIYVKKGDKEGSVNEMLWLARNRKIPVVEATQEKLDFLSQHENHQGIVALRPAVQYASVDDILELAKTRNEDPFIVIVDGVQDPHNLGAIIRCADCAGAHGIIIPKRRACGVTPAVAKTSAGASEHVLISQTVNLSQTVSELQSDGIWVFASDAEGEPYYTKDYNSPMAMIIGGEDSGVSHILKQKADFVVSIPMYGHVNSMNASCAAAVLLTYASRMQRTCKQN